MRKSLLLTRGVILDRTPAAHPWTLTVPHEATVLEVAALMSRFRCYGELDEGADHVTLVPLGYTPPPSAKQLADFYAGASLEVSERA